MVRHPESNRPPLRILQSFWHFACGRQDECVWPGRHRLDQSVRPVVDPRVSTDLGQIPADEREVVLLVSAPNPVDSVDSPFVTNVGTQCVAGVGRVRDQAAVSDDPDD